MVSLWFISFFKYFVAFSTFVLLFTMPILFMICKAFFCRKFTITFKTEQVPFCRFQSFIIHPFSIMVNTFSRTIFTKNTFRTSVIIIHKPNITSMTIFMC
eukprot:Lithocolla_globosa_v1_NODE_4304_length_1467_cov_3.353399.p2 type:complete len:100 gc:universal NODE_4304_length_1467_cov_3.353399:991-692(-)